MTGARIGVAALASMAMVACAMLACAHAPPPASVGPGVCEADAARLCPGVKKGEGRVLACLKSQAASLSPECRLAVAAPSGTVSELGEACRDDAARVCPGVPRGEGRVIECLRSGWYSLSPPCQTALWAAQEKKDQFESVCGDDAARLCPGVAPGEGRLLACLESRASEVSAVCRALLAR